jgi:cysteine-rich repeat protein
MNAVKTVLGWLLVLAVIPVPLQADEIGVDDFRISEQLGSGAVDPVDDSEVAYNSKENEYFVVWVGDTEAGAGIDSEVIGQRLASDGSEIAPEFQISNTGAGEPNPEDFGADDPDVAYNPTNNEYLIVWEARPIGAMSNIHQIFGRRIDALTGAFIGSVFPISDDGLLTRANDVAVTYNETANEYLVVWRGGLANTDAEIFGQRVRPETGTELAGANFQISNMGVGEPNPENFRSFNPDVTYNAVDNEYLAVWAGQLPIDGRREIFGQRISADGMAAGVDDFQISALSEFEAMPSDFDNFDAEATHNTTDNEYLVVWEWGSGAIADEIYGQRLQGNTKVGGNFQISDMGVSQPNPDDFGADAPRPIFNPVTREYLVLWHGDHTTNDEFEIFGQRLDTTGDPIGSLFQVSRVGNDGVTDFTAREASVAVNTQRNEYLVTWHGDDNTSPLVDNEFEVFGQLLAFPDCGDGFAQPDFEECDDGNADETDTCKNDCTSLPDGDGDGVNDSSDNCPEDANPSQADADGDGTGDACEEAAGDGGGGCSLIRS